MLSYVAHWLDCGLISREIFSRHFKWCRDVWRTCNCWSEREWARAGRSRVSNETPTWWPRVLGGFPSSTGVVTWSIKLAKELLINTCANLLKTGQHRRGTIRPFKFRRTPITTPTKTDHLKIQIKSEESLGRIRKGALQSRLAIVLTVVTGENQSLW